VNNDAYLRRIDRELRRIEREVFAELRPLLITSVVAIRRLISLNIPDEGLARNLAYTTIKPRLEEALVTFNDTFALRLSAALEQLQTTTLGMAFDHLQSDGVPFVFITSDQWLDEVRVFGGWTLRQYFQRRSPSQFMKEILRLVDRTVQRGLMQGLPTEEIARQIVPEVVSRGGRPSLTIRKGTILNAIRNRVEGTIAQAIWTVATHKLTFVSGSGAPSSTRGCVLSAPHLTAGLRKTATTTNICPLGTPTAAAGSCPSPLLRVVKAPA
jgi:hypothetical protein